MPKKASYAKLFKTYLLQEVDDKHEGEVKLTCPLCDKEEHFYANCDNGLWHCKVCDQSGNATSLLTRIHANILEQTTDNQYAFLSEFRGISPEILKLAQFAYDDVEDRWLVPYFTWNPVTKEVSSTLNNLGYFYPSSAKAKGRFAIRKAGGLNTYLYNPQPDQTSYDQDCYMFEGEWDALAFLDANRDSNALIVGKPGSGYNAAYNQTLKETKKLFLCLDNDASGKQQTVKVMEMAKKEVPDIKVLDWSLIEDAPNDIRDLWMAKGNNFNDILDEAFVTYDAGESVEKELIGSYTTSLSDYEEIHTFDEYTEKVSSILYTTPESLLSMAAIFAVTNSIRIPGEPLWMFLISPPSSGKTTFIDSFGGNNELFDNLSKITSKSLVSGWREEGNTDDASYLSLLRDKTLFVKDFTVTLSDSADTQRELFGLLTDIYDGTVKIPYGNNQVKEYHDLYFNMIAGVTDIVHSHSAASIGERFLRVDYLGRNYDPRDFARRALQNFGKAKINKQQLIEYTLGFVNTLRNNPLDISLPDEYLDPIADLAEFVATIRTKVEMDRQEGMKYRARTELPSRLCNVLAKLFVSARSVFQTNYDTEAPPEANKKAFDVVHKVAMDTAYGFPLDLVLAILKNPRADRATLAKLANIDDARAYRVLNNLEATQVIVSDKARTGGRGQPAKLYSINPKVAKVLTNDSSEDDEGDRRGEQERDAPIVRRSRRVPPRNRRTLRKPNSEPQAE